MTGPARDVSPPPVTTYADRSDAPVRLVGLEKRFGSVLALAPLDLEIRTGEVFGCLGSNGAGKTTLLRLLLGLLRPTAGRAIVFGRDATLEAARVHARMAYVPGETSLWPGLTGGQTLHLLGRLHGSVDQTYREELVERFGLDPSKRVRAYSKGNRQKVALIAALATRADLLLLDEPTGGLDPLMEEVFRGCIREARDRGQTVVLSSHIMSEVEALCDRIAILRDGRLCDLGTLDDLRHLAALEVAITFAGTPPDLSGVPGVIGLSSERDTVTLRLRGPVAGLLDALHGADVIQLLSHEPSLEELFLAHYGRAVASPAGSSHAD